MVHVKRTRRRESSVASVASVAVFPGEMVASEGRSRELARCVDDLVRVATPQADPRQLHATVEDVLDAFSGAAVAARDAAVRSIGRALGKAEGRGAQILSLTLGALVESGATPRLAWPAIAHDLHELLESATAFATAAIKQAKNDVVESAIEAVGAVVAKKKPREAAAWSALPSRCLAAVACLTRSKELRASVSKDQKLLASAWRLSDVVSEVGVMLQAVRILDDSTLLVLAPGLGLGWRVAIDSMPSNLELYVLLADALIGDPKKGLVPGKRIDPKAVAAIRDGTTPKKPPTVTIPFHLVSWTEVKSDGSLPAAPPDASEISISPNDLPADIPSLGSDRIVLLDPSPRGRHVLVEPTFEATRPQLRILEQLPPGEVVRIMIALAQAAMKVRERNRPPKSTKARGKASKAKTKTKVARAKTSRRVAN